MSYLPSSGLGEETGATSSLVGAPWWCSPAMPQGSCTVTAGVCKPMNQATITLFQMIQRRINALLAKRKKSLINVDGRIGSATVSAMRAISSSPESITGCDVVAKNSLALVGALDAQMASEGAVFVPDPKSSRPSTVGPDGNIVNPPDGLQISPVAMMLVAVSLGAVVALGGKKRSRR